MAKAITGAQAFHKQCRVLHHAAQKLLEATYLEM